MTRRVPSLDAMVSQFRRQPGLYLTGAGTSAPFVKIGQALMRDPATIFVRGGCISADIPRPSDLNKRLIAAGTRLLAIKEGHRY